MVVSPDAGGLKWLIRMRRCWIQALLWLENSVKVAKTVANHLVGDVAGRNTLLVDDMTSTAGSCVQRLNC